MTEQPAPFFLIVSDLDQRFFCVEGPMTDDRPWITRSDKWPRQSKARKPKDWEARFSA
jgi:hypothetical protein